MIAYNHFIDFIPKLECTQSTAGSFSQILTVKKSPFFDIKQQMKYHIKFFNNQGREMALYSERKFSPTQKGQQWALEIEEIVSFFWESGTKTLLYMPHKKFTEQLLEYWSLHIVIPIYFTVEETYDFLHSGAIEVNKKPILFVAESFGGKSTMTDFFLKQGHTLVSDDKVATYEQNGVFFSVPSIPFHRPYRKMEDLGYFVENVASNPKHIHAIYELEKSKADVPITITELHGIEKFKSLRYSSEINLSFLKAKRFVFLSRLAKTVRVYKVSVPWDMDRLGEVHDVIVEHCSKKV